jgi:hypothetical protein
MRVKYWHKVWMSGGSFYGLPLAPFVVDHDPEFMNLEEQQEVAARRIAELGLFQFLCRPALSEGVVSDSVIPISIAHVDRDEETGDYHFPNPLRIQEVCSLLAAQSGVPMKTLLAEQDALLARGQQPPQARQPANRSPSIPPPATPQPTPPPATADAAQVTPSLPTQRRYRVS